MPQCHIQKHPDLKNLIFTTQMRYLIQRDYMETSTGKARRLAPVLEQVMSRVVSRTTKPEYKEAIRSRFWNFPKMRTKLFEELAPDYRACGRHEDFFTIYRLGPRKRDSCERALMQLADRPFSLEIALKFFRAQKMAAQEEKTCVVPSVNLAVPKHLKNAKPREFRSKKHNYLWVQDKKEKEEPMATDEEYRLRVVDLTDGFDKKDSLKNERKKISDILSRTVFLQQSPKVTYPSDYLKRLLATITAAP